MTMSLKLFILSVLGPFAILVSVVIPESYQQRPSQYSMNLDLDVELYQNLLNNLTKIIFLYNKNYLYIDKAFQNDVQRNSPFYFPYEIMNASEIIHNIVISRQDEYFEFYRIMFDLKKVFEPPEKYYKSLKESVDLIKIIKQNITDFEHPNKNQHQQNSSYANDSHSTIQLFEKLQRNLVEIISFYDNNSAILDRYDQNELLEKSPLNFRYDIMNGSELINDIVWKKKDEYAKFYRIISDVEKAFVAIVEHYNGLKEGVALINIIEQEMSYFEIISKMSSQSKMTQFTTNSSLDDILKKSQGQWFQLKDILITALNKQSIDDKINHLVFTENKVNQNESVIRAYYENFYRNMPAVKKAFPAIEKWLNDLRRGIDLYNIIEQDFSRSEHLQKIKRQSKVITKSTTSGSKCNLGKKLPKESLKKIQICQVIKNTSTNKQDGYAKFHRIISDVKKAFVVIAEQYNVSKKGIDLINRVEDEFSRYQFRKRHQSWEDYTDCRIQASDELKLYRELNSNFIEIDKFYIENYNITDRAYQNHVLEKAPSDLKSAIKEALDEVTGIIKIIEFYKDFFWDLKSYKETYSSVEKAVDSINFIVKEIFNLEYQVKNNIDLAKTEFIKIIGSKIHYSNMEKMSYNLLGQLSSNFYRYVWDAEDIFLDIVKNHKGDFAKLRRMLFFIKTAFVAYVKESKEPIDLIDGIFCWA